MGTFSTEYTVNVLLLSEILEKLYRIVTDTLVFLCHRCTRMKEPGVSNCKSKKGESACSKCGSQKYSTVNFVCNVVLCKDDVLVAYKIFNNDITSILGEKDAEH